MIAKSRQWLLGHPSSTSFSRGANNAKDEMA
jgi:hypothetical protein